MYLAGSDLEPIRESMSGAEDTADPQRADRARLLVALLGSPGFGERGPLTTPWDTTSARGIALASDSNSASYQGEASPQHGLLGETMNQFSSTELS
jgi:hypothetical protein